ncbi:MAG: GFA family protein [Burkholderiaceae bacterium]
METQRYKGSCHCGAIHFSFETEPITKGVRCNCSFCSKRGALLSLVPEHAFKTEVKEDALNCYQFGPKKAKHYFCRHCGIQVFSETTRRPGQVVVNLNCVEEVDMLMLETIAFDGKNLL